MNERVLTQRVGALGEVDSPESVLVCEQVRSQIVIILGMSACLLASQKTTYATGTLLSSLIGARINGKVHNIAGAKAFVRNSRQSGGGPCACYEGLGVSAEPESGFFGWTRQRHDSFSASKYCIRHRQCKSLRIVNCVYCRIEDFPPTTKYFIRGRF